MEEEQRGSERWGRRRKRDRGEWEERRKVNEKKRLKKNKRGGTLK